MTDATEPKNLDQLYSSLKGKNDFHLEEANKHWEKYYAYSKATMRLYHLCLFRRYGDRSHWQRYNELINEQ